MNGDLRTPTVLVGNKVDIKDRKVKAKMITYHREHNMQYYDVSTKTNYNIEKPFLWIARKICGDANLQFVEKPIPVTAATAARSAQIAEWEAELARAAAAPLDGSFDDDDLYSIDKALNTTSIKKERLERCGFLRLVCVRSSWLQSHRAPLSVWGGTFGASVLT